MGKKHVHLLIKSHERFEQKTLAEHQALFEKAASKIKNGRGERVFKKGLIDFQLCYDDSGVISYCFKQIDDRNLSRVKIIDRAGLHDTLDDF